MKFEEAGRKLAANERLGKQLRGFKPWYSDASLIEHGAKRVFVGINPAGDESTQRTDEAAGYIDAPYDVEGWNAILDEQKPPSHPYNVSIPSLFTTMYGEAWETELRKTVCFNLCPHRTRNTKELPEAVARSSVVWFRNVLNHIQPEFVICMGNKDGDPWDGPWAALDSRYTITQFQACRLSRMGYSVKHGKLRKSPHAGVRVLGLPLPGFGKQAGGLLSEVLEVVRKLGVEEPFF